MNELAAELRGIHVLVIDDDQFARHSLRSVLEFSGALVTAARAADAIRAALVADVIVCDHASAEPLPTSSWSDFDTCTSARDAGYRPSLSSRSA